jgi:hypothetical protein
MTRTDAKDIAAALGIAIAITVVAMAGLIGLIALGLH